MLSRLLRFKDFVHLCDTLKGALNTLTELAVFKPLKKLKNTHYSTILVMIHDGLMAFISLFCAIYLKVGDEFFDYSPGYLLKNLLVFMLISLGIFSWAKTYKTLWRFISVEDLWPLSLTVILANFTYLPAMHFLSTDEVFSKSILILNIFVMIILLSVPRFFARFFHDQAIIKLKETNAAYTIPVLLVGDDDPTELFIRAVTYTPHLPYHPVGIITTTEDDDDNRCIHGVPILGNIHRLHEIMHMFEEEISRPRQIIIMDNNLNPKDLQKLFDHTAMENILILQMVQHFSLNILEPHDNNKKASTSSNKDLT